MHKINKLLALYFFCFTVVCTENVCVRVFGASGYPLWIKNLWAQSLFDPPAEPSAICVALTTVAFSPTAALLCVAECFRIFALWWSHDCGRHRRPLKCLFCGIRKHSIHTVWTYQMVVFWFDGFFTYSPELLVYPLDRRRSPFTTLAELPDMVLMWAIWLEALVRLGLW